MICPVILCDKEDNEKRRVGIPAHIDGKGYANIDSWAEELLKDEFMRDFFKENPELL